MHPLDFHTNFGPLRFNVWDVAGRDTFDGLRDGYYIQGECAIIMFDVTSRITYTNVPKWHRELRRICEDVPIVLCGNKTDADEQRTVTTTAGEALAQRLGVLYCEISTKTNYNCERPFLYLARKICNESGLSFGGASAREEAHSPPAMSGAPERSPPPFGSLSVRQARGSQTVVPVSMRGLAGLERGELGPPDAGAGASESAESKVPAAQEADVDGAPAGRTTNELSAGAVATVDQLGDGREPDPDPAIEPEPEPEPEPELEQVDMPESAPDPDGAAQDAAVPENTAAQQDEAQREAYEAWLKLDNQGLIEWVKTIGLLPTELADVTDSFQSNAEMYGSSLEEWVNGEAWIMENQFPDDFGALRVKLINAVRARDFVAWYHARSGDTAHNASGREEVEGLPEWMVCCTPAAPPILPPRSKHKPPYHQYSSSCAREQFCAVHALNNVFCNEEPRLADSHADDGSESEAALFTVDHLNAIAERLQRDESPQALLNPHRWLCLGNFDAAVINSAAKLLGYRPDVFGKPYTSLDLDSADLANVAGFIVTSSSVRTLSRKHSYCIREVDGYWWRLDGKNPAPVEYPDTTSMLGHLQLIIDHGGSILRIRRAAPNIYAMGVDDVANLLRSLGLGEPLPYVKRCRDMRIDGFWLSRCGDRELEEGRLPGGFINVQKPGASKILSKCVQLCVKLLTFNDRSALQRRSKPRA